MSPDRPVETNDRPATARVFFALWPSPEVAAQLGLVAAEAAKCLGGRPSRPETIHLTLAFLGDVAERDLPSLTDLAGKVAFSPFELLVDRLAVWRHNRLLWAACQASEELAGLAGNLRRQIVAKGFSIDRPAMDFLAHVTLVRGIATAMTTDDTTLPAIRTLRWPCREFVLVRSSRAASGAYYEVVARFPGRVEGKEQTR